jgi:hypothetical protein
MPTPCDCPHCRKDNILNGTLTTEYCPLCSVKFDAKSSFQIMTNKILVCDNCVNTKFVKCNFCNELHRSDTFKIAKKISDNGVIQDVKVCDRCFEQKYRECLECHDRFNSYSVKVHGAQCFCQNCFNKKYQQCTHCSAIVPIGTLKMVVRGGHNVCDTCFDYYGPIDLYERKVKTEFHGMPPHFMGVELEVEMEDGNKKKRGKKAQEVQDLFPQDFVILKEDGSLGCGFEIVTQPTDLIEHKKMWNPFFDKRPENLKSFNTTSCGLHVHCSRKPLSLLTIAKIVVFVNGPENKSFVETIAGRGACRYCAIKKKNYGIVKTNVVSQRNERYEAVNLCNKDTIEFRLFKGTLKRESFFKAIEFCDSLVKFCMTANYSVVYCRSKENYIAYVESHKKDYPHLNAFISAKILKKETDQTKKYGFLLPNTIPNGENPDNNR